MKSETTLASSAHLWAVGYDDQDRAAQVRQVIVAPVDIAALVRSSHSSLLFNGELFPVAAHPIDDAVAAATQDGKHFITESLR